MIEVKNISKAFSGKQVLHNLSFTLQEGEHLAIMGKSGIGKTTLLMILAGLVEADSGELNGVPAEIAMVFQENRLLDAFSAYDNIALLTQAEHGRILAHFAELGLAGHMDKAVKDYSGGMKRRVALMRALLAKSSLILMDEPFKGLDESTKESVIAYTKKHIAGKTAVLITHDGQEAETLGVDRIFQIE